MTIPRPSSYVWCSWLVKFLVGDRSCLWAAWFMSHHTDFAKVQSGFNVAAYQIQHATAVRRVAAELAATHDQVFQERQNTFQLDRSGITIGGRPDLIAVTGRDVVIVDVKTGGYHAAAHTAQVMVYMVLLPLALPQYRDCRIRGRVQYAQDAVDLPPLDPEDPFCAAVWDLIDVIGGSKPPARVPSIAECDGQCPLTPSDCPERMTATVPPAAEDGAA